MCSSDLARRLKAAPETTHIPIIFMTGLTETEYLVAALESGGVDYVTKPIKPKEVLARMGVHLAGARERRRRAARMDAGAVAAAAVAGPKPSDRLSVLRTLTSELGLSVAGKGGEITVRRHRAFSLVG